MLSSDFFLDALSNTTAAIAMRAEKLILEAANGKSVIPCSSLELEEFARLGHCQLLPLDQPRPNYYRHWGGEENDQLLTNFDQVVWQVNWKGFQLEVVHLEWETSCGGDSRDWVIADNHELAERFILTVERKTHAPGDTVLVFAHGRWIRSRQMYQAIQSASFDDLILGDKLREQIISDFQSFLASEEQYQRLGISWRRGALLVGPPGNGKTHCVRALAKQLDVATLYVQSLSHPYYTSEQLWSEVFKRARGLSPCVLVLEDLDSLVDDDNRSYFLNQLDGLDQNHGLIVLATTNYPERIDAAVIDRPSRFDRKYHFGLPDEFERKRYLQIWHEKLADETEWSTDDTETLARATEGYTFAYLKELVISTVMQWMKSQEQPFVETAKQTVELLAKQMKKEAERPQPKKDSTAPNYRRTRNR